MILQSILRSILAATQSVASVAVNSTGLSTNSVIYQSQFLSSDAQQDWTGNLYAFPVSAPGSCLPSPPLRMVGGDPIGSAELGHGALDCHVGSGGRRGNTVPMEPECDRHLGHREHYDLGSRP